MIVTGIKPSQTTVILSLAPQSSRPWLHSHLVLGTIAPQSSRPWLHGHIVTIHQTFGMGLLLLMIVTGIKPSQSTVISSLAPQSTVILSLSQAPSSRPF